MTRRPGNVVVVGTGLAGLRSAETLRARGFDGRLTLVGEETHLPYERPALSKELLAGKRSPEQLTLRQPEFFREQKIELVLGRRVEKVSPRRRTVLLSNGRELVWDALVIATGARARRLRGLETPPGVHYLRTLSDALGLSAELVRGKRLAVVGAGFIGVEMAEALVRRGVAVTVIDQAAQPMTTLDPDMGAAVSRAMEDIGIDMRTDTAVIGFETGNNHRIRSVLTADGSIPADVVVLGLGARPNTALAQDAGLALGDHGGLRTNIQMQVLGHDHIWAGGDCVEVLNLVSGQYQHVALGTHANKQGRVIGHNLAGSYATFPGVVGTAMSKVCHLEIARTGLRARDATRAGFEYVTVTVRSTTKAGYFPGTQRMTVKMTAERCTGRLLGVQIVGQEGSAKRIDTAATALWNRMTVEEMAALDLAYAPPFAPVWDPILVAARQAAGAVRQAGAGRR